MKVLIIRKPNKIIKIPADTVKGLCRYPQAELEQVGITKCDRLPELNLSRRVRGRDKISNLMEKGYTEEEAIELLLKAGEL